MTRPGPREYWETVRRLHPEQLRYQMWRRVRRLGPQRIATPPADLRLGPGWEPRVARCYRAPDAAVLEGAYTFWGETRELPLDRPWLAEDQGLSWNYPVHYFDAAPDLAAAVAEGSDAAGVRRLQDWLLAWIHVHPPGSPVAWDPYTTSMRIVNWFDVLHLCGEHFDSDARGAIQASLWVQSAWLAGRLERHLLGTHLLKNLKALLVASSAFQDARALEWGRVAALLLERELASQVLADGSHAEPSLTYHNMALADLLDLLNFGAVAMPRALLESKAQAMLGFATAVETPAGGAPPFGDEGHEAVPATGALRAYAARLGLAALEPELGPRFLPDAGYFVWRDARQFLVADVGTIGPPHLSAHGHCDSLSFEYHLNGVPMIVDAGTRTYELGPERLDCRSVRSHNTIEIDAREQHEIWSAFRVARRAEVHAELESPQVVRAQLVPWHAPGLEVERRFEGDGDGIRIRDRVQGSGSHRVVSRIHLHPDAEVKIGGSGATIRRAGASMHMVIRTEASVEIHAPETSGSVSCESPGRARPSWEIRITQEGPFECEIEFAPGHES